MGLILGKPAEVVKSLFGFAKSRAVPLFAGFRRAVNESEINALDRLPVFTACATVFLSCAGFFFGRPLSPLPFWICFAVSLLLALCRSPVRALCFVASMALAWLVSAFSFTYVGWDAAACHFPMAQAIVEGWNPVLSATAEGFKAAINLPCAIDHILCAPKVVAIMSACVSKSTGLFTAAMFLPACLWPAAVSLAYGFARSEFGCGKPTAAAFALAVSIPLDLLPFAMIGKVDLAKYLAVVSALFALVKWIRTKRTPDAIFFFMLASVCAVSKTAGIVIYAILVAIALAFGFGRIAVRRLALASLVFVLVAGASPYLTQWIHFGSPFYPAHSFVESYGTRDLTNDFIARRNADALKMGRAERIAYAWFSSGLAVEACRKIHGNPDFNPDLTRHPSSDGLGENFRLLMCISLCMLPFIRNKRVLCLIALIFLLSNIGPVKYLGFARYFPEMYAIPYLAFMGFAYNPRRRNARFDGICRTAASCATCYAAAFAVVCAVTWFGFNLSLEALRQVQYAKLAPACPEARIANLSHDLLSVTATRRMMSAGIEPVMDKREGVPAVYLSSIEKLTMVPAFTKEECTALADGLSRSKFAKWHVTSYLFKPHAFFKNYRFGGGWPHPVFQPCMDGRRSLPAGDGQEAQERRI